MDPRTANPETLEVRGMTPVPQGSKRLVRFGNGRTGMIESAQRLKPWRNAVASAAVEARLTMRDGPVSLRVIARWPRPQSHFGTRGLRPSAPIRPGYADLDKIARGICDALTGIAYRDDRQVAHLVVTREWCADGEAPGASITVASLTA